MKSKIYYGEYSLEQWIRLMLTQNIVRPEYQRSFVWEKEDVVRLVNSLKDGSFVQPVTIALNRKDDGTTENIILDGQQRLTSILLARIGYIPDKAKFRETQEYATETDQTDNSDEDTQAYKKRRSIEWTFSELLEGDANTIDEIIERVKNDDNYEEIKGVDIVALMKDKFFEETFLGFSYIVLDEEPKDEATTKDSATIYFAKIFKNMNYWGMKLSALESRRSLYYMNQALRNYFDGKTSKGEDVLCDIKLLEKLRRSEIDFVRYLSILSQYFVKHSSQEIMRGYASYSSRENFYTDYVAHVVGLEQEDRIEKFNGFDFAKVFPDNIWKDRLDKIHDIIESQTNEMPLKEKAFTSYIDADYWLFGLIYWVLFEGNKITFGNELYNKIITATSLKRRDDAYAKSPNRLGNLRERIDESINIYSEYATDRQ